LLSQDTVLNEMLYEEVKRDFSSVPACMWTLFTDGTLYSNGDVILTELMAQGTFNGIFSSILMLIYMLLSSLVIMNMLIGCLCEVVSSVQLREKEEGAKSMMRQTILIELQKFDNGDGKLTRKELSTVLKSPEAKAVLRSLQIDELFLKELQSMLFPHVDSQVSIHAVMQLMLSCRGDLSVTVLHLARGQAFISTLIATFEKKVMEHIGRQPKVRRQYTPGLPVNGCAEMMNGCAERMNGNGCADHDQAIMNGKEAFSL